MAKQKQVWAAIKHAQPAIVGHRNKGISALAQIQTKNDYALKATLKPKYMPMFFGSFCYLMLVLIPSAIKDKGLTNLFTQIITYREFYENVSTLFLVLLLISGAVAAWALKYTRIILKPTGIVLFSYLDNRSFIRWEQIHSCWVRNFLGLKHVIICILNRKGEKVQFLLPMFLIDLEKLKKVVNAYCEPVNPLKRLFKKNKNYNRIGTKKIIEYTEAELKIERQKSQRQLERLAAGEIDAGFMAISADKRVLGIMPNLSSMLDNPFTYKDRYRDKAEHLPLETFRMSSEFLTTVENKINTVLSGQRREQFKVNIGGFQYMCEIYPSEIGNGKVEAVLLTFMMIKE